MRKIYVSILLVLTISLNIFIFPVNASGDDSSPSDWAQEDVEKALSKEFVPEIIQKNYTQNITRLEFCKLMLNMLYCGGYKDIMLSAGYSIYPLPDVVCVSVMKMLGYVKGKSEDDLSPDDNLTREEMAVIIYRIANKYAKCENKAELNEYCDSETISSWATEAMGYMIGEGIIRGIGETRIAPKDYVTREQAIVTALRFCMQFGRMDKPFYAGTDVDILSEYEIIDDKYLNSEEYVTVYDALLTIDKARCCFTDELGDLKDWYLGETLASKDYLDDSTKSLLLRLCYEGRNHILNYNEIAELDLEGEITLRELLVYILRMLGNSYGCTDSYYIDLDAGKERIFNTAHEKGIVSLDDIFLAESKVSYKDFCKMLHKSLFVIFSEGGYGGVSYIQLMDRLVLIKNNEEEKPKEKEMVKIPVSLTLNDDMSLNWEIPQVYTGNGYCSIEYITTDGKVFPYIGSRRTSISSAEFIEGILRHENEKWSLLRIRYTDTNTATEYYYDVDISNVRIITKGSALSGGKYVCQKDSWYTDYITLDSDTFEEGCYYLLKGRENKYRVDTYNGTSYECFISKENNNIYTNNFNGSFGLTYMDEVYIRKVEAEKDSEDGFILTVSPWSEKSLEISKAE